MVLLPQTSNTPNHPIKTVKSSATKERCFLLSVSISLAAE